MDRRRGLAVLIHAGARAEKQLCDLHVTPDGGKVEGGQVMHPSGARASRILGELQAQVLDATEHRGGEEVDGRTSLDQEVDDGAVAHLGGRLDRGLLPGSPGVDQLRVSLNQFPNAGQVPVRVSNAVLDELRRQLLRHGNQRWVGGELNFGPFLRPPRRAPFATAPRKAHEGAGESRKAGAGASGSGSSGSLDFMGETCGFPHGPLSLLVGSRVRCRLETTHSAGVNPAYSPRFVGGLHRPARGMGFFGSGLTYSDWGRIRRLSDICSSTWAVQPAARELP